MTMSEVLTEKSFCVGGVEQGQVPAQRVIPLRLLHVQTPILVGYGINTRFYVGRQQSMHLSFPERKHSIFSG